MRTLRCPPPKKKILKKRTLRWGGGALSEPPISEPLAPDEREGGAMAAILRPGKLSINMTADRQDG